MDLEKVSEERLSTSTFRIRSEAFLSSGQRFDLGILELQPSLFTEEDDEENEIDTYYNRNKINENSQEYEERTRKNVILKHQSVFYLLNLLQIKRQISFEVLTIC